MYFVAIHFSTFTLQLWREKNLKAEHFLRPAVGKKNKNPPKTVNSEAVSLFFQTPV